jgi:hypothetical protein
MMFPGQSRKHLPPKGAARRVFGETTNEIEQRLLFVRAICA